jgi:hypothetical protein
MLEAEQALKALRESVLALTDDVAELAQDQVGQEAAEAVHAVAATVRGQSYHVVVCGEFKRGKSSLLNAIMGRQQLFPTGQELTTATVMTLRWGPQPRAVARTLTAGGAVEEEVPLDDLARYVSALQGAQAWRVSQLDVELPHDRLTSGVILVDTPGIGGVDEVHSAITLAFLPSADAVVVVLSAVQPATISELEFAKRALAEKPATIFALAMADKCLDLDLRLEATRARLSSYLDLPPEEINIVPVSSTEAWYAMRAGDQERLAASGLPALENEIWTTLIAQAGARRLRAAVGTLMRLTEDASAPIASELAALGGPVQLAKVLAELDANEQAALAIGNDLADHGRLERDFASRVSGVEQGFSDRVDQVLLEIRQASAEDAEPITPEALAGLARAAADAGTKAFAALRRSAVAVANDWERRTAQPLRVLDLSPHDGLELPGPPESVRQRVKFTPAVTDGAQGAVALSAPLATIGGLIGSMVTGLGTAVGATIGGLIGQVVGFFGGVIDHVRRTNARARARLLRGYADQLVASLKDYRSDTVARIEDTQQDILQHLKVQMRTLNRAQLSTIGQARLRVQQAAHADADRKAARATELQRQRDVVGGYAARLHDVGQQLSTVEASIRSHA